MRTKQRGVYTVEFAIIGVLLFTVLFSVIEVGRTLFVWNTLTEATRRGARIAAVCGINHGSTIAKTKDLFPDKTTGTVVVTYFDRNGMATTDPAVATMVKVEIQGYQHHFVVPGLNHIMTAPRFETTIPTESLGYVVSCG